MTTDTGFRFVSALKGVKFTCEPRPERVLIVGPIGPTGSLTTQWPIPELGAGAQSSVFYLQPVHVDALGQSTLGSPACVVLLDQAF